MTTTPADAQAAADQAAAAVTDAENKIASGRRGVSADMLNKLRDAHRHAQLTLKGAQQKAAQQQAEARTAGLTEIGTAVDQIAAEGLGQDLPGALQELAGAAAKVRRLAAAHDADVAQLIAAANDLQVEPKAPGGPRASSAGVAVHQGGILHGRTHLLPVGANIERAIADAVAGDPERGASQVRHTATEPEPRRPRHLIRTDNGVHALDNLPSVLAAQLRSGQAQELTDTEADRYMAGEDVSQPPAADAGQPGAN